MNLDKAVAASPTPHVPSPLPRRRSAAVTWLVLVPTLAVLVTVTAAKGRSLWGEWLALQEDRYRDVHSRVVGFLGVNRDYSFAKPPSGWLQADGDRDLLWAGWDRRKSQHLWFEFPKGQLAASHLSHPMGRDNLRAIDDARVETRGGVIWKAIPPDHLIAACEFAGLPIAYPMAMLDKVIAVNDLIYKRPVLVVYTPFEGENSTVELFDSNLNNKRLTLGHSGYLYDQKPLLYDRQTESLWVSLPRGMEAVAGPHKGTVLKRLAHMNAFHWGEWSDGHPDARLVVGANRAHAIASR